MLKFRIPKRTLAITLIAFSALLPIFEWIEQKNMPTEWEGITQRPDELFDPELKRLQNSKSLTHYIDSIYGKSSIRADDTMRYVSIASSVIKRRFFHGYSYFRPGFNTLGWAMAPLIKADLSATVLPDDILKFPNAACSQQSIVFIEILKRKQIPFRKVGFNRLGGHYASEARWNGKWHFYDVNIEPDTSILESLNRPSMQEILQVPGLIDSVYKGRMDSKPSDFFQQPVYGSPEENPAPRAGIYQHTTRFLSCTLPLWLFLAFWMGGWFKRKIPERGCCV